MHYFQPSRTTYVTAMTTFILALCTLTATPITAEEKNVHLATTWNYNQHVDHLTGQSIFTATIASLNTVRFQFPYDSAPQRGYLSLRKHPREGNTAFFALRKGQINLPPHGRGQVNIRYGGSEAVAKLSVSTVGHGIHDIIIIDNHDQFVANLQRVESVTLEIPIYNDHPHVFTFNVNNLNW